MMAELGMIPKVAAGPLRKDARWWTEWNLENWAAHMRALELPDALPSEACGGIEPYTSLDLESEDDYEALCGRLADTTAQAVAELPAPEMSAVQHRYLERSQYQFWRFEKPYGIALEDAVKLVEKGLKRRGVWLGE